MKSKELFIIVLTVFLTIVAWIVSDVYHILNTQQVKIIDTSIEKPINIKIDTSVFPKLEQKK